MVSQTFPGQNYSIFPDFSRHFVHLYVNTHVTKFAVKCSNFLYDVFFCSKYRIGLKFFNFELQMLCVMNCEKINKCIGNQRCNTYIFSRSELQFSKIFPDFSILMIIFKTFQSLENFYIKFQDFPHFSRICTNPDLYNSIILNNSN